MAGPHLNHEPEKGAANGIASLDGSAKVPVAQLPQATETAIGVAEIATQAETDAGTDDVRYVTPLKLANFSGLSTPGDQAAVQARRTTAYPLTTTFADVTLDVTDVENDAGTLDHDLATNTDRILIGDTGPYRISYHVNLPQPPASTTQDVLGRVRLNDTTVIPGSEATATVFADGSIVGDNFSNAIGKSFVAVLTAGDFITLQLQRTEVGGTGAFSTKTGLILTATRLSGEVGPQGPAGGGSGDVTAAAALTENKMVFGDSPAKGVKTVSEWTYDPATGKISGVANGTDFALTLQNLLATGGGAGLKVMAGEVEDDIVFRLCDADDTYLILDVHADNGQFVFGAGFVATKAAEGVVYGIDQQNGGDEADFNTKLGGYRVNKILVVENDADLAQIKNIRFASEVNVPASVVDWNLGQKRVKTLTANTTFTFTALTNGVGNLLLRIVQGGAGGFTVTWPASVQWPGGVAPVLNTAAGTVHVVSFYWNGTNYYGVANTSFS